MSLTGGGTSVGFRSFTDRSPYYTAVSAPILVPVPDARCCRSRRAGRGAGSHHYLPSPVASVTPLATPESLIILGLQGPTQPDSQPSVRARPLRSCRQARRGNDRRSSSRGTQQVHDGLLQIQVHLHHQVRRQAHYAAGASNWTKASYRGGRRRQCQVMTVFAATPATWYSISIRSGGSGGRGPARSSSAGRRRSRGSLPPSRCRFVPDRYGWLLFPRTSHLADMISMRTPISAGGVSPTRSYLMRCRRIMEVAFGADIDKTSGSLIVVIRQRSR